MQSKSLTAMALEIIDMRGQFALNEASRQILQHQYENGIVSKALKYYAKAIFPRVLPIFPALIYLSCKIVGGNPVKTKPLATAMLLITASGDIHDDIIDRSTHKFGKYTVFGKYGKDIALLAGDALLVQGMELFQKNCTHFQAKERKTVTNWLTRALFKLVEAEASEIFLWKKANITPQECFEVIIRKATVAELHCKIGGIVAGASKEDLTNLMNYGRLIGILSIIKDEFLDTTNFCEFRDRLINEMLPYPVLCAFQNDAIKTQLLPIMMSDKLSRKNVALISKVVFNSVEVQQLKKRLSEIGERELVKNSLFQDRKRGKEAEILLKALSTEL